MMRFVALFVLSVFFADAIYANSIRAGYTYSKRPHQLWIQPTLKFSALSQQQSWVDGEIVFDRSLQVDGGFGFIGHPKNLFSTPEAGNTYLQSFLVGVTLGSYKAQWSQAKHSGTYTLCGNCDSQNYEATYYHGTLFDLLSSEDAGTAAGLTWLRYTRPMKFARGASGPASAAVGTYTLYGLQLQHDPLMIMLVRVKKAGSVFDWYFGTSIVTGYASIVKDDVAEDDDATSHALFSTIARFEPGLFYATELASNGATFVIRGGVELMLSKLEGWYAEGMNKFVKSSENYYRRTAGSNFEWDVNLFVKGSVSF